MEVNESLLKELSKKAINIRRNIIEMVYMASSGHPGGALSIVDIFCDLLSICFTLPDIPVISLCSSKNL